MANNQLESGENSLILSNLYDANKNTMIIIKKIYIKIYNSSSLFFLIKLPPH
jgi:hypothetical protein